MRLSGKLEKVLLNKQFTRMKYNRKSKRLKEFNYSLGYWYLVTFCVRDMKTYLGKVRNGRMMLNENGKIVDEKLECLISHYSYVDIDYRVVMSNRLHAIVIINLSKEGTFLPRR